MWTGIILFVIVVVIAWWLMTRNTDRSQIDQTEVVGEHHQVETIIEPEEREDDLTLIEGIGPKINSILKMSGIKTFQKLSETKPEDIRAMLNQAGIRLGNPSTWPEQANLAAQGKLDDLKALQDSLKGGRIAE